METMYDRIKRMNEDEMRNFIYWVYLNGNKDGEMGYCDSDAGYFGRYMLTNYASDIMPNDAVDDLWDTFEKIFYGNK